MTRFIPRVALGLSALTTILMSGPAQGAGPTPNSYILPLGLDEDGETFIGTPWNYLGSASGRQTVGLAEDPSNAPPVNGQFFEEAWYGGPGNHDINTVYNANGVLLSWQTDGQTPFEYGTVNAFGGVIGTALTTPVTGDRYGAYFRTTFNAASSTSRLFMNWVMDDAGAVYIDGQPIGTISGGVMLDIGVETNCCVDPGDNEVSAPFFYTDLSTNGANSFDNASTENNYRVSQLDLSALGGRLSAGSHEIAVEVHQQSETSSDLGFDLGLFTKGNARVWAVDAPGDWSDPGNWEDASVPDSLVEFAVLGNVLSASRTLWLDQNVSLDGIQFEETSQFIVAGDGQITLQGSNRDASLNVLQGAHQMQIRFRLGRNTDAQLDGEITFNNRLNLNNRSLRVAGTGSLNVRNNANTGATGTVSVSGGATIGGSGSLWGNLTGNAIVAPGNGEGGLPTELTITGNATAASLDVVIYDDGINDSLSGGGSGTANLGVLNVTLDPGYTPANGHSFTVASGWSGITLSEGTLADISPLSWDTSQLGSGILSIGDTGVDCDFNDDGACNITDIDALMTEVAAGTNDPAFNLTSDVDAVVDDGDRDAWLAEAAIKNGFVNPYQVADSDLDRDVDIFDLNALAGNWNTGLDKWSEGNYSGADVNIFDLNALAGRWNTSAGAAALPAAVPEPTTFGLLSLLGLLGLAFRKRG